MGTLLGAEGSGPRWKQVEGFGGLSDGVVISSVPCKIETVHAVPFGKYRMSDPGGLKKYRT